MYYHIYLFKDITSVCSAVQAQKQDVYMGRTDSESFHTLAVL